MVGYPISHTLSKNGSVSRGICEIKGGNLSRIVEKTHIETDGTSIWYKENETIQLLDGTEIVSMNLMGFSSAIFTVLEDLLSNFFTEQIEGMNLTAVLGGMLYSQRTTVLYRTRSFGSGTRE